MDIFILICFYSFLYKSFKIYVKDKGNHVGILEMTKFKNIFRLVAISVDASVGTEAEGIFETLELFLLLLLLAPLRLPYSGTRKSDSERIMLNTFWPVTCKLVFRPEATETIETDMNL